MSEVYIDAVGLFAPGLTGWRDSVDVLRGQRPYVPEPLPKYRPQLLSSNERRRATNCVRIAFGACEDAIGERLEMARELAGIFVSSGGDFHVQDQICRGLLRDEVMLSPTQFHNSVHNAPAGYWSIASGSTAPSVSLSAFDYSVSAGLLEAVPFIQQEQQPSLLVYSDADIAEPLRQKRPVLEAFAAALWLTPQRTSNSLAALTIALEDSPANDTASTYPALDSLRKGNPAARILPLLEALARGNATTLGFPTAADQQVLVSLHPM